MQQKKIDTHHLWRKHPVLTSDRWQVYESGMQDYLQGWMKILMGVFVPNTEMKILKIGVSPE